MMSLKKIKTSALLYFSYVVNYQMKNLSKKSKKSVEKILETQIDFPLLKNIEVFSDYKKNKKRRLEGACVVHKEKMYILFMASNSFQDWLSNLLYFKKKIPYNNVKNRKIKVHRGYIKRYTLNSVRTKILLFVAKHKDIKEIIVTGYSMGGGLAPICAVDLAYNFPEKEVSCIAMAGPRIGNRAFINSLEKRVSSVHISYGYDPIVKIPPRLFGFKHISKRLHYESDKKRRFWKIDINDHYPDKIFKKIFKFYKGEIE